MADHEDAITETQPLENKPDEQLQEETASRTLPQQPPLEELRALQLEMEPVNKQASRAFYRFKLRMKQKLQYHLDLRSNIIQGIPGFWAKTVSLMHDSKNLVWQGQTENECLNE